MNEQVVTVGNGTPFFWGALGNGGRHISQLSCPRDMGVEALMHQVLCVLAEGCSGEGGL